MVRSIAGIRTGKSFFSFPAFCLVGPRGYVRFRKLVNITSRRCKRSEIIGKSTFNNLVSRASLLEGERETANVAQAKCFPPK